MPPSPRSSAPGSRLKAARLAAAWPVPAFALLALLLAPAIRGGAAPGAAGAQRDPELRAVVQQAIQSAQCFGNQYDSAVWYTLMEPRLRRYLSDREERLDVLRTVYCETHRPGAAPLPPGLVLAVLEVESRFDRWAVSATGAVGLMQVMPYWPEQLGMQRRELVGVEANIRMGCAILRHYLATEHNDVRRALGRYNGSVRSRDYPDRVVTRWTRFWNGADDLGRG
ncbi:MAG TPA: lytic transglycosylase domain-containing protein [Steroidobacteraceae bacterium]|nr:lytic transglycosylase domain-containing protein [Steroidobacteraceae bacterium]